MNDFVPLRAGLGATKVTRTAGLILMGTTMAAMLIGWMAFLLWLAATGVVAVFRWA